MARSQEDRKCQARLFLRRLKENYPDAHCALIHSNPLELLVATILSAQCTDERVNKTTPTLFAKYRSAQDYASASLDDLESDLRSINFFRNKAKSLKGMGQRLVDKYNGEVPKQLEDLISLPGVGRKTANVVLGNVFGITEGIVVDTHVQRLAGRLGLTSKRDPVGIEEDLCRLIPHRDWVLISHLLIFHGRQVCKARRPLCDDCSLVDACPQVGVG